MRSVYPTYLDPLTQNIFIDVKKYELLTYLKTQCLFFDVVSPSVSHILFSSKTYEVIKEVVELLEYGVIRPQIPEHISNISEYVDWRINPKEYNLFKKYGIDFGKRSYLSFYLNMENYPPRIYSNPTDLLRERIRTLEIHTRYFWRYKQDVATNLAYENLLLDLDPHKSKFKDQFKDPHEISNLKTIINQVISETGKLNRPLLVLLINRSFPSDKYILKKLVNANYFMCGSAVMEHMLGDSYTYLPILIIKAEDLKFDRSELTISDQVFTNLIRRLSINQSIIINLTIDDILDLRKWVKKTGIYKDIWNIIDRFYKGEINNSEELSRINHKIIEIQKQINEEIESVIETQKKMDQKIKRFSKIASKSKHFVTFVGTSLTYLGINEGILAIAASQLIDLVKNPIINFIRQKKANFIVFAEKLARNS